MKLGRYLRYAVLGVRILFPTPSQRRYLRAIRDSGLFDRGWYLACYPRMPLICRLMPERHYVLVGEVVGLCPSPDFSPRAYLHLNPALAAEGTPPFAHYIARGRAEGRAARDLPSGASAPAMPQIDAAGGATAPHAVLLHLFYRDQWPAFAARLRDQPFAFDLFVSLTEDGDPAAEAAIRAQILRDFPAAQIWSFPNLGRDILPFLHIAASGRLAPYAAVCKLHTKASPHRADGALWREALAEGILAPPGRSAARLAAFAADPAAGFWVADGHVCRGPDWIGANGARMAELAARLGLAPGLDDLAFAAGSIWWVSQGLLAELAATGLTAADFEPEMGQVDGTTAHALERLFGLLALRQGYHIVQTTALDGRAVAL